MEQVSFLISKNDGSSLSSTNDPADPSYNPVYLLLDSTSISPDPSEPVELAVSLPSGYSCEEARISFEGTSAFYWEVTTSDPSSTTPLWSSSVNVAITNDEPTSFWIRSSTIFEEVPVDDRSSSLRLRGEVYVN